MSLSHTPAFRRARYQRRNCNRQQKRRSQTYLLKDEYLRTELPPSQLPRCGYLGHIMPQTVENKKIPTQKPLLK